MEEELEGLVTHLRNAKGTVLVDWLQQVNFNYILIYLDNAMKIIVIVYVDFVNSSAIFIFSDSNKCCLAKTKNGKLCIGTLTYRMG